MIRAERDRSAGGGEGGGDRRAGGPSRAPGRRGEALRRVLPEAVADEVERAVSRGSLGPGGPPGAVLRGLAARGEAGALALLAKLRGASARAGGDLTAWFATLVAVAPGPGAAAPGPGPRPRPAGAAGSAPRSVRAVREELLRVQREELLAQRDADRDRRGAPPALRAMPGSPPPESARFFAMLPDGRGDPRPEGPFSVPQLRAFARTGSLEALGVRPPPPAPGAPPGARLAPDRDPVVVRAGAGQALPSMPLSRLLRSLPGGGAGGGAPGGAPGPVVEEGEILQAEAEAEAEAGRRGGAGGGGAGTPAARALPPPPGPGFEPGSGAGRGAPAPAPPPPPGDPRRRPGAGGSGGGDAPPPPPGDPRRRPGAGGSGGGDAPPPAPLRPRDLPPPGGGAPRAVPDLRPPARRAARPAPSIEPPARGQPRDQGRGGAPAGGVPAAAAAPDGGRLPAGRVGARAPPGGDGGGAGASRDGGGAAAGRDVAAQLAAAAAPAAAEDPGRADGGGRGAERAAGAPPGAGGREILTRERPQRVEGYHVAYVGNLPPGGADAGALAGLFGGRAAVAGVRETAAGRARGFAHVHFRGAEGLEAAVARDGEVFRGRALDVQYAQPGPQGGWRGHWSRVRGPRGAGPGGPGAEGDTLAALRKRARR